MRWHERTGDRIKSGVVASLLSLCVAACGGQGSDDGPEDASQDGSELASSGLEVALLTSGPVSDAGWYAGAYEGIQLIERELGARVSHLQTRSPAEYDEAFRSYGADGYDIVFAHGFEYQDAAARAGALFPDMTIVVSGGGRVLDNVVPLIFRLEEASYLAGLVAGMKTSTGVIGMVGGVEIPPVKGTFDAFRAGVLAGNPEARVLETFIGDWDDVAAAKEAAIAHLRAGADVIIHNTDAASFGVFQAVREANTDGATVWAFGMNSDQNDVAPDVILGSAVIHFPQAFLEVARRYEAGTLEAAPIYTGVEERVIDFVFNPAQQAEISDAIRGAVDQARTEIRAGTLEVPRVPFVEDELAGQAEGSS